MIEAKGTRIYSDGKLLCTVELVGKSTEWPSCRVCAS